MLVNDAGNGGAGQDQGADLRADAAQGPWWRAPRITAVLLTIWVAYATVHVFIGQWYWVPRYHYLTPFYSPCVSGECARARRASAPGSRGAPDHPVRDRVVAVRAGLPDERATTTARPTTGRSGAPRRPARSREPHASYTGETRFPLILQNIHRLLLLPGRADRDPDLRPDPGVPRPERRHRHGPRHADHGVNVVLIWAYTLSCHSCRHITGGRLKHFSKHPVRYRIWT